jgi:TPR repeat protein
LNDSICLARQKAAKADELFSRIGNNDAVVKGIKLQPTDWGYVVCYNSPQKGRAYILALLPEKLNRFTLSLKCRIYPVDPDTRDFDRIFKAHVKESLGEVKVSTRRSEYNQAGIALASGLEFFESSIFIPGGAIHQEKVGIKQTLFDPITNIFNNLPSTIMCFYRIQDIRITIDKSRNIICKEENGRKYIFKDNFLNGLKGNWTYYGLTANFSHKNKPLLIAPEFEFTKIDLIEDKDRLSTVPDRIYPRYTSKDYLEKIKKDKNIDAMYWLGMNYFEGTGGVVKDYYEAFKWLQKAASKKHVFAQYQLGLCYLYGWGVPQNNERAMSWLVKSANYYYDKAQTMAALLIINGVKRINTLNKNRYIQSFLGPAFFQGNANAYFLESYCFFHKITSSNTHWTAFREAADRGHPKAYYYLGLLYSSYGDRKRAFVDFQKAAELKFIPAYVQLGDCYLAGTGTEKNAQKAFGWYKKAAVENDPEGLFKTGCCYAAGIGVKQGTEKAGEWFLKAAETGFPRAELGLTLLKMANPQIKNLFFSGQEKAAAELLQQEKDTDAQFCLGLCLKYGIGIEQDRKAALPLLLQTSKGNCYAALEAGDCYEHGLGTSAELHRAAVWYQTAAKGKSGYAAYRLAELYAKLKQSPEAFKWYGVAAKLGNADAAFKFGMTVMNDQSASPADYRKALKIFEVAAQRGHIRALYVLGDMYYKGLGVKPDKTRAAAFWNKYEKAFKHRENNSIHGIYWKDFPVLPPVEYDADGLPTKYTSTLKSREKILEYYKEY